MIVRLVGSKTDRPVSARSIFRRVFRDPDSGGGVVHVLPSAAWNDVRKKDQGVSVKLADVDALSNL